MRPVLKFLAFVVAAIVLLLVGVIVATWAPDRPVDELKAEWAPAPSQFLDVAGMQVHLRDEGVRHDPAPIVLLHGTSSSLHTWDGWVAALAGERRVIRVDLPGFGLTGPTPDGDYTIASYVRFMGELLARLGIEHCVLAGNSFGGQVAWETALALSPSRVVKLVLVDAAGYPLEPESMPVAFHVAQVPLLRDLMQVTLPRGMVESSLRNVYGDPSRVTPALVDRYFALTTREGNREALVQRFRQAPHGPGHERIRELRVPTLILWGERDRLIPPSHAERFHRDIAGSRLVVLPGLGHTPHEEDPAASVAAVQRFLAET